MPKARVRKHGAPKSEMDSPENQERQEVLFVRLENIPIDDALHEKKILEKGDFARKLNPEYASGPVILSDGTMRRRIIEVYKRCFQEADLIARLKVVSDFIAHFPHLIFEADWLKEELVRVEYALPDHGDERKKEALGAIAKGFRRAASRDRRVSAVQKSYRKSGAQMVARTFQNELSKWNEGLDRVHGEKEWITARAGEKAEELIKTNSKLGPRNRPRLTKLLTQGHCYEAAIFIASKVFGVRERDLETGSD